MVQLSNEPLSHAQSRQPYNFRRTLISFAWLRSFIFILIYLVSNLFPMQEGTNPSSPLWPLSNSSSAFRFHSCSPQCLPTCILVFVILCDCLTSNVAILYEKLTVPLEIDIQLSSQSPVYSILPRSNVLSPKRTGPLVALVTTHVLLVLTLFLTLPDRTSAPIELVIPPARLIPHLGLKRE